VAANVIPERQQIAIGAARVVVVVVAAAAMVVNVVMGWRLATEREDGSGLKSRRGRAVRIGL
jgi:hypothetical protein